MPRIEHWREKCYANVPERLMNDLKHFRSRYPYKKLLIRGQEWNYILTEGGAETILMLPGSTATGESNWREFPRFTPDYLVMSLSYPPVKTIEELLEGVRTILDQERITRTSIIGASMGGAIAHWFIRKYPERVKKLVILSLGLPGKSKTEALRKAANAFSFIPYPIIRTIFGREGARLVSVLPKDEAALMTAYFRDQYRNDMNKRTMIAHFRLVADLASKVTELGLDTPFAGPQPVLLINAADDETVSAEEREALQATYPDSRRYLFPSGGHTMFGCREELFRMIEDFIRE